MPARIIFDISTLARWSGPPVGIVRVEGELARWAGANIGNAVFAFFEPDTRTYRVVKDEWVAPLLDGVISANPWAMLNTNGRRRRSDRIPRAVKPAVMWILQSRRNVLLLLERIRLRTGSPAIRALVERVQRPLITPKYRRYMFNADGSRKPLLAHRDFLGSPVAFTHTDTLVCAGATWAHSDISVIKDLKDRFGIRFTILCFDIIPLLYPQFFKDVDAVSFDKYYRMAFPLADLVICNAEVPRQDAIAYCKAHGITLGETCVVPLGADGAVEGGSAAALPVGIEHGRYAIFVSTLEPRKGHQMLCNVWLKLLADGIPQKTDFKLVFVGREGWHIGALLDQLTHDERLRDSVQLLLSVEDQELSALYQGAAFCLYPSAYEGYGLPIIESFLRGKAVLASTGGAIPEVVDGFSPCLDPHDEALWQATLARWISDPAARAPYEEAIRTRFCPTLWSDAAKQFFAAVARPS